MLLKIVTPLFLVTGALAQVADFEAPHHPSRVLVKFQPGANLAARQSAHENAGILQVLEEYSEFEGLQLVEVAKGAVEEAVKAYFDDPSVLHAEPDYDRYPAAVCNSNDPHLLSTDNRLWSIKKVRAPEVWCLTTGNQNFPVAVIDSGIMRAHPDLNANIWTNPLECPGGMGTCVPNTIDEDANGKTDDFYGWNFLDNNNDTLETSDDRWHGTHVSGTLGAVGNNAVGVVGMNWRVKLVALKILPSAGPTQASHVIAAMNYCIQKNIKVSNNSYGGHGYSVLERDAIQNAGNLIGHIFVAAAGNDGLNLDTNPQYPASYQVTNIITVTATNEDDFRGCMKWVTPLTDPPVCERGANYGAQTVHLGAPGATINPPLTPPVSGFGIYSTVYRNAPPVPGYDFKVGTSMAAPHVAGAVALAWAAHPTWTYQQVRSLILNTVDKGTLTGETTTGGRLDIGAALLDCNNNSVADGIDLNTFTSLDCNDNRIPDECDGLGGCCLPEGGGECCITEAECDNLEGSWSPFLNCLVCLQFAPSGP